MIEGRRAFRCGNWPDALTLEGQPFHLAVLVRIGENPAQVIETGLQRPTTSMSSKSLNLLPFSPSRVLS